MPLSEPLSEPPSQPQSSGPGRGSASKPPRELPDFADAVLDLVERVPSGHVVSYGDIAAVLGAGPRQVARVMSTYGAAVPWHRVLRADGTPAPEIADEQIARLWAEGVPMNGARVDMRAARWDLDGGPTSAPAD